MDNVALILFEQQKTQYIELLLLLSKNVHYENILMAVFNTRKRTHTVESHKLQCTNIN